MTFGILKRYVMGEVLRSFLLCVLTMTIIFVLFMVMAEATKMGLSPHDIATLIPFIIPSTLPYTVPVSMLFAVTVVYGRLASDNEVIAVKSAGISAMTILWPALIMGAVLSASLLTLSASMIPLATHRAKLAIIKNFEDAFYKALKLERELNNPEWPFMIKVRDVDGDTHTFYEPTFKHRAKKGAPPPSARDIVLLPGLKDVGEIPTAGLSSIVLAEINQTLHFRIFDNDGKVVADTDSGRLNEEATPIENLRKQLEPWWPPHVLTPGEKFLLIDAVTTLIGHTPHTYDMTVQARTANIYFDLEKGTATVHLVGGNVTPDSKAEDVVLINNESFVMELPEKGTRAGEVRIQERTTASLTAGQADIRRLMANERARQAMSAALWISSGRIERVDWVHCQTALLDFAHWTQQDAAFETEKQQRVAQSFGSFVFVLLGAPVGILFARRDFLSAFMTCFIPIIGAYYPLMLLGINLGKEGQLNPILALWAGNVFLSIVALFVYPRVLKH